MCLLDLNIILQFYASRWNEGLITAMVSANFFNFFIFLTNLTFWLSFTRLHMFQCSFLGLFPSHITCCMSMCLPCMFSPPACSCVCALCMCPFVWSLVTDYMFCVSLYKGFSEVWKANDYRTQATCDLIIFGLNWSILYIHHIQCQQCHTSMG